MDRDRDTLYMDYSNILNIQTYIARDGASYLDALTVEAIHLHAVAFDLKGFVNIVVDDKTKEDFGDLIKHLEAALRENTNRK
ncbi:hypothetical protein [Paenibacillus sp. FSL M8-0142]|uniref:hypothetical protein n=1 Tax=Paenibacillus sp. FSL M8-0142 TaxID=2954525 RepID=UPI00315AA7F8